MQKLQIDLLKETDFYRSCRYIVVLAISQNDQQDPQKFD